MSGYLDTRDLDKELDELQERADAEDGERGEHSAAEPSSPGYDATEEEQKSWEDEWEKWDGWQPSDPLDDDEKERLAALVSLKDEIGSEWEHGVTLIAEYDFEDYARELANDCGDFDERSPLANYIDWERWARDVQMDFTSVEFDGDTYYYRG